MNFAHIDDREDGVIRAQKAIQAMKAAQSALEADYSQRVYNWESYDSLIDKLKKISGGLILSVDRELKFDSMRELAAEHAISERVWPPGRHEEGIAVALAAIKIKAISPLLIVLSSTLGNAADVLDFLSERIAETGRSDSIRVISMEQSWYFSFKIDDTSAPQEKIRWTIGQYLAFFPTAESSFLRLLDAIEERNPHRIDDEKADRAGHHYADEKWKELTEKLLGLAAGDVDRYFSHCQRLSDVYKELGLCPRLYVSTGSAWFVALAAYRHLHPEADWTKVFDPQQLTDDVFIPEMACNESVDLNSVLPRQKKATLRSSVDALYKMFAFLVRRDEKHARDRDDQSNGPLKTVDLRRERLTLEFAFPLTSPGRSEDLARLLSKRLRQSLGVETAYHETTNAFFAFWILSMVADETNVECYSFPGDCLRMSLRPGQNSQSTILQFAREHGSLP